MIPIRFVVTTYNLWKINRWPQREESLRAFVRLAPPDILCIQELRPQTRDVLDEELRSHARVEDPFEGWTMEGTIYWNERMFEYAEHGAEQIGMLEELRRLFWARLRVREYNRTILVATAHYTYQGNKREATEGYSPRLDQARSTVTALDRLARPNEPVLFMGDLNDSVNPIKLLRAAGFADSFTGIGRIPTPTHPAVPTATGSPQVLDWQFSRGPIRCLGSEVVDFFVNDIAPSDHKPVSAVYGFDA